MYPAPSRKPTPGEAADHLKGWNDAADTRARRRRVNLYPLFSVPSDYHLWPPPSPRHHRTPPLQSLLEEVSAAVRQHPVPEVSTVLQHDKPSLVSFKEQHRVTRAPKMCQFRLHLHPCGDSYLIRSLICQRGPKCTRFEVVEDPERFPYDCFACRKSPKRRMLPARARGIFALS